MNRLLNAWDVIRHPGLALGFGTWCTVGLLAFGLAMWPLLVWAHHRDVAYDQWCRAQGGHVATDTRTTTVSTGRGVGIGTSSTDFCLSDQGGIIDIR